MALISSPNPFDKAQWVLRYDGDRRLPTRSFLECQLQRDPNYQCPKLHGTPIRMHELLEAVWINPDKLNPHERPEREAKGKAVSDYWSNVGTWLGVQNAFNRETSQRVCDSRSATVFKKAYFTYLDPIIPSLRNFTPASLSDWSTARRINDGPMNSNRPDDPTKCCKAHICDSHYLSLLYDNLVVKSRAKSDTNVWLPSKDTVAVQEFFESTHDLWCTDQLLQSWATQAKGNPKSNPRSRQKLTMMETTLPITTEATCPRSAELPSLIETTLAGELSTHYLRELVEQLDPKLPHEGELIVFVMGVLQRELDRSTNACKSRRDRRKDIIKLLMKLAKHFPHEVGYPYWPIALEYKGVFPFPDNGILIESGGDGRVKLYKVDKLTRIVKTRKEPGLLKQKAALLEALLHKQLSHSNIAPLLGITNCSEIGIGIVLESYQGEILQFLRGSQKIEDVFRFARDIASGLSYLHREGIVHGDLHSGNILIEKLGENLNRAVIIDFGHSRYVHDDSGDARTGKEAIRAPEFEKKELGDKNFETDVYACGTTLNEMLKESGFTKPPPEEIVAEGLDLWKGLIDGPFKGMPSSKLKKSIGIEDRWMRHVIPNKRPGADDVERALEKLLKKLKRAHSQKAKQTSN